MVDNLKFIKARLSEVGISITKKEGEYKVNYKKGKESTAYYTDNLSDAFLTGIAMAFNWYCYGF